MLWSRILFLAAIVAVGELRAAETPSVVKEVAVRNIGPGRADEQFVLAQTTIRVGAELDRNAVSRDVKALLGTGQFSDVDVRAESVTGGVRVVYVLRSRLRLIREPAIRGCEYLSAGKVRKLLELTVGDPVDDRIVGEKVQKVLEKYRKKSYTDAIANWSIRTENEAEGLASVTVTITEGVRSSVRKVVLDGNHAISDAELYPAMEPPPWWNVFRWFSRDRYERDLVEMAQVRIKEIYLDRGYLEAEVDPPLCQKDARGHLTITYRIREGIRYRFGPITLDGFKRYPETEIRKAVKARTGDIASQRVIDAGVQGIEDLYGARGYPDTVARPVLQPDRKTGIVAVLYVVKEGELVHIRNIRIEGNTRTRDKVIRREIRVHPGEVYDKVRVRTSERVLENLQFFSSVRADGLDTMTPGERDLLFSVEEKSAGQFNIGAGFSSVDKIIGFAELSQGNFDLFGWPYFTGGGQKLRLRTEYGARRKEYLLSFTEPWFLDRRLALGFDVWRREVNYSDYDVKRTGVDLSLTKGLFAGIRSTIRYRLEQAEITDVADTNRYVYLDPPHDDFYFARDDRRLESSVRLTLSRDSRNHPFLPTYGNQTAVFGEVMGGPFGADTDLYHLGFSTGQYVPLWFGHVLFVRGRWEVMEPFGDSDEIPLDDRLYIGGGRTVRGYDYRDVGPKVVPADSASSTARRYRAAGGRSLALAKADYTVPIVQGIRMAAFFDIGNVWRDAYDFDANQLASSTGVGIRLDIPGFPISIDRAWSVKKDNEMTDTDKWVFWIGYDF
jgi:outer membrane protein insertion porin family